jgi:hypothetical protein
MFIIIVVIIYLFYCLACADVSLPARWALGRTASCVTTALMGSGSSWPHCAATGLHFPRMCGIAGTAGFEMTGATAP